MWKLSRLRSEYSGRVGQMSKYSGRVGQMSKYSGRVGQMSRRASKCEGLEAARVCRSHNFVAGAGQVQ
jgi:hypothetical protein